MIVTIANRTPEDAAGLVAENLALLRALSGRKVLLLDATSKQAGKQWAEDHERLRLVPTLAAHAVRGFGLPEELERLYPRHADVIIDADGGNGHECRSALIMAQVAVVPLVPAQAGLQAGDDLIARLNNARMFNPGLRVLFVAAGAGQDPAPCELQAMRSYAAQVMAASLAHAFLHLPVQESSSGAAEMAALYEEVYLAPCAVPPVRRRPFLQQQGSLI